MKQLTNISLTGNQSEAITVLRQQLLDMPDLETLILFGSIARGEANEESDVDILVVTTKPFTRWQRHEITDLVFEKNLKFDTNFSALVVDKASWESGIFSVLPIRSEILQDGIRL